MTLVSNRRSLWWWMLSVVSTLWLATPTIASAAVRFDGLWDDGDRAVTVRAENVTRQHALQLLAEATGWSIVAHGLGEDTMDLSVREQPPAKVLEMILSGNEFAATRDGDRVTIDLAGVPAVPAPPLHQDADRDRTVFGGNLRIEKGERVQDVEVLGGHVDVWGVVEGDLDVLGGEARLHQGAHVLGDVSALGGSLHMDDYARVDGDVEVLGGAVHRAPGAHIGGAVSGSGAEHPVLSAGIANAGNEAWTLGGMVDDATGAMTRTALLFILGVIFWALGRDRMEALEVELAKRPMRSLAMGVVGALSAVLIAVALLVTVVGIPFAVTGLIITVVIAYVGACVVLSTIGQAFLRHRTENRYVHLALGCGLFLLFTAIPYVGSFIWLAVLLTGLGAVVVTRGAGLLAGRRPHPDQGPYRTAAI